MTEADLLRAEFPKRDWSSESLFLALPAGLQDELAKVKGLFQGTDREFETRLRLLTATGLAEGHSIYSQVLDSEARNNREFPESSVHTEWLDFEREVAELFGPSRANNVDGLALQSRVRPKMMSAKLRLQAKGYVGWLITHDEFHRELAELRKRRPGWFDGDSRFARNRWEQADGTGDALTTGRQLHQAAAEYRDFLRRWCLHSLLAWRLPEPMDIQLRIEGASEIEPPIEGVELAIPWALLRSSKIDLAGLLCERLVHDQQSHLLPWLRSKKWGPDRYGRMLEYYVYLHLVLKRRYQSRLVNRLEQIDQAFARYWAGKGKTSEKMLATLKKIKAHLAKRLDQCTAAIAAQTELPDSPRTAV